jgi:hypothetical protein
MSKEILQALLGATSAQGAPPASYRKGIFGSYLRRAEVELSNA